MPPKQDVEIDDRTYEVQSICRKRIHRGQREYLLKWAGWEDVSNTWETWESLDHMVDYVNEFDASVKSRICEDLKKKKKETASSSRPFIANPSPLFSDEEEESSEEEEEEEEEEEKEESKDEKDDSDYDVNVKVTPGVRRPIARTCKNVKNKSHEPSKAPQPSPEEEDCNVNIAPTPLRTPNRRPSDDDDDDNPELHVLANPQVVLFADPI